MQENAEQYFLSTKARFQLSEDEEDAAELYFAAHNLANHGHEVEWDTILEKMEDLLKKKGAKTEGVVGPAVDVGGGPPGDPKPLPRGGKPEGPDDEGETISFAPFIPTFTTTVEGRPKSMGFKGPANAFGDSFGESGKRRSKAERDWSGDIPKVAGHRNDEGVGSIERRPNLAAAIKGRDPSQFNLRGVSENEFIQALAEEISSRPENYSEGGLDSFGAARLFIENSRIFTDKTNPVTYDVWRDEFHPESPHHVSRSDVERDARDRETIENSIATGALEGKSEEEKARILNQARENLLHLSDDALGVGHDMARSVLFNRGFKIWDEWYKEVYPNSPLLQGDEIENLIDRKTLCIEHKYLKMDGCPLTFIKGVLYDEDGDISPYYKNNPETAYLGLTKRKWADPEGGDDLLTYDDLRDKSWQLGDQAWLRGFDLLDFNPREDNCNEAIEARELYHDMIERNLAQHELEDWKRAENSGQDKEWWGYSDMLGPKDILPGHFTEREAMAYMQRAMFTRGMALGAYWTSSSIVPHQHQNSETISPDAKIYERTLNRAIRDAHRMFVSKDDLKAQLRERKEKVGGTKAELIERLESIGVHTGLQDGRPETGPQPILDSLLRFYGDVGWDFQRGLPLDCKPRNAADVKRYLSEWLDSGAITAVSAKQIWERLDLHHEMYGDPTSIYSSRKESFKHALSPYSDGLESRNRGDVDVLDYPTTHKTTGQNPLLRYLLVNGGLGQSIEQPLYNLAVRNPLDFMELGEAHQTISDMPKEAPPDSALGKEIKLVERHSMSVQDIKESSGDRLEILRRVALLLEPEYDTPSAEGSGEVVGDEDIGPPERRDPLELDTLIYNAKRARWGELHAKPGEISQRMASSTKEFDPSDGGVHRMARLRNRGEPHHGDVLPVSPMAAATYLKYLSPDAAAKLYRALVEMGQDPLGISWKPSEKLERIHGVMLDNATLGFTGGANGDMSTIDHTLGTHTRSEHQRNKDIKAIHSPSGMRLTEGSGSVNSLGTSVSHPRRASHSYGSRDKAGVVADEDILRHAQLVLTAHLHGYNHSKVMRFGKDSAHLLKYTAGYLDSEKLVGKAVIQEPRAFQEILRKVKKLKDVPREFRFLESPFFDDGDFSNFWAMMLSSKGRGEEPTEESWRERVESEKHLYPLVREDGKYFLDMEQIPTQNLYLPPEKDSVHWREATHTTDSKTVSEWMEERVAIDGGTLSPLSFRPSISPNSPGSLRPESYDLEDEDTRAVLASRSRLEVNKQHIVEIDGVPMVLGEHPSELKGQWAEEVLGKIPLPSQLRGLPSKLLNDARNELRAYTPDSMGMDESIEYRSSRSGLSKGMVMDTVRDEHNTKMALASIFHLVVARDAKEDAEKWPMHYQGMSPSEIFDDYFSNHIALSDGLDKIEEHRREVNQDLVKRACLNHLSDMRHDTIDKLVADHEEFLGDDMSTHSTGENYIKTILRPALKETPLGVYDKILRREEASGMDDLQHPMRRLMRDRGDRQALGHEIVRHYILGDSRVQNIIQGADMTVENALEALGSIVETVETEYPQERSGTISDNIGDMRQVGHHSGTKGAVPLDWWEEALDEHVKQEMVAKKRKQYRAAMERKGFTASKDWDGQYIPSKELIARKQGAYARQAKALRDRWLKLNRGGQWDQRALQDEVLPLLIPNNNGDTIIDIIRKDLSTFKTMKTAYARDRDRPHFAFPEHRTSIGHSTPSNRETTLQNLAHFLFCEGRTTMPGKALHIIQPSKGFREKRLPFGLNFVEKPLKYVTDYAKTLFSGTSDSVDIGGSTFSSSHTNLMVRSHFGVGEERMLAEPMTNEMVDPSLPALDTREAVDQQPDNVRASVQPVDKLTSLDVLTDVDLLFKEDDDKGKEKGDPLPIKAMHRIFTLKDLEHLRGFSDDWVVSSWPKGERVMVSKKKESINVYNHLRENITLPNKVKEGLKDSFDKNFLLDCVWGGEILHIVDILESGKEKLDNSPTKDRNRHLRTNFSATEEVTIPAPINTKRVDSEGLERAIEDLLKEPDTKQILLRDADASYMRGETRHPKWVMLTPEHQIDVRVVYSRGGKHCLGIGPILTEDALELGNRARKLDSEHYMDVGKLKHEGLKRGDFITVSISGVSARKRNGMKVYTLQSPRYLKDSESGATDSIDSLEIINNKKRSNIPHKVRVKKGSIHIELPVGHVVYDTEPEGNAFILKGVDAPNDYVLKLVESQIEYWEPLAAVLLRSEKEAVVPEPPANHDKKPKKVLPKKDQLLKDPEVVKGMVFALEVIEGLLKEKITWTGPKALGIDYATPVESPHGPTKITEPYDMPDHDPAARQAEPKACWCGAEKGEKCKQGRAHQMEDCPKAHPPKKKKEMKHLKVSQNS